MSDKIRQDIISTGETVPCNKPHFVIRPIHFIGEYQSTTSYDHNTESTEAFGVYRHNSDGSEKCLMDFIILSDKPVTSENFTDTKVLEAYWNAQFYADSIHDNVFRFNSIGTSYENMKKLNMSLNSQLVFKKIFKNLNKKIYMNMKQRIATAEVER